MYLLTRPVAWLFKLLVTIVKSPYKLFLAIRNQRMRSHAKEAAKTAKVQRKAAEAQLRAAQSGQPVPPSGTPTASGPTGTS